jgi:hypothetical protein
MDQITLHQAPQKSAIGRREQRRIRRHITTTPVCLMYSGWGKGDMVMGDGVVVDLSEKGLGLYGDHPVTLDMELTVFVYFPEADEPLFTSAARVVWVSGRRFGVELMAIKAKERDRLLRFLKGSMAGGCGALVDRDSWSSMSIES